MLGLRVASLFAAAGDADGHRRFTAALLDRYAEATVPFVAERAAKANLLLPPPPAELPRLVALADRAVRLGADDPLFPYYLLTRGMAAYRAGAFDEATDWLGRVLGTTLPPLYKATARTFLAMSAYRLGHADRARSLLDEARRATIEIDPGGHDVGSDSLINALALREAEALIGPAPEPDVPGR